VTDAAGRWVRHNYDGSGRVSSLQDATGTIATYTYTGSVLLTRVTYADASFVNFTYDASSRILNVTDTNGKVLEAHTYDGSSYRGKTSERATECKV